MGSIQTEIGTEQKYEIEHAKRVAAATNYGKRIEPWKSTALADMNEDHWVDYDKIARETPLLRDGSRIKFLIVGAGHSGIMHAYHLVAAGFSPRHIVLVDVAGGWGGTWYWNRYPGLQCDVEGYCYLPLLEESGFVPRDRYSKGEEIRRNAEHIASKFKLQGMFCTKFVGADWNEQQKRWDVRLRRQLGSTYDNLNREFVVSAQFMVFTIGYLNNISIPSLPGIEDFKKEKPIFHTARWNYEYTGGSQADPRMGSLKDQVVGVIGTAASAVQAVPELAKWTKHLYVFQRTPIYMGPHEDSETTPELWDHVTQGGKPGWQYERMENLNMFFTDDPEATPDKNMVRDERSNFPALAGVWGSRRGRNLKPEDAEKHIQWMMKREQPHSDRIREHIKRVVKDPTTAEKLTPWYPSWCKRPAFNNTYLEAFNSPNVTLVDTDGQGVQSYTENGVVVGTGSTAHEYGLDAVILATGFELAGTSYSPPAAAQGYIHGRGGCDYTEKYNSSEFASLFGVVSNGFPNLFLAGGAGGSRSANLTSVLSSQARFTAHIVKEASSRASEPESVVIEVAKEAEEAWVGKLAALGTWFAPLATCPPTYFTAYEDKAKTPEQLEADMRRGGWPLGPVDFDHIIRDYIKAAQLDGINIHG